MHNIKHEVLILILLKVGTYLHYSNYSDYILINTAHQTFVLVGYLDVIDIILPFLFPGSGSNAPNEYLPDRPIGYGAFGVVWSVTDPRDGKRVALKKLPNVFQSLVSSKRVFRELKMMRFFKHENVLSCLDILQVHINLNMLYVPT